MVFIDKWRESDLFQYPQYAGWNYRACYNFTYPTCFNQWWPVCQELKWDRFLGHEACGKEHKILFNDTFKKVPYINPPSLLAQEKEK